MKTFCKPIYITRPIFPNLQEYTKELKDVWKSQWISNNGPKHQLLEKKIKKVLKVPYVSLFNNGTTALLTAIKVLKLTGEVITTPFTFPATPHCLTWNNITPVFCDIDPVTMNIDADKIESLITPRTSGILAVHVFGTPCDVEKIKKIAKKHKLKVIYDAAHSFGLEINRVGTGNFGDISMFSFHPTKLFHSAEGGALTFKDKLLKQRIDLFKNFGIKNQFEVAVPGINGKMNELQAVLGLLVLKLINGERKKRKIIYETYLKCLKDVEGINIVGHQECSRNSYQYFVIRIDEKEFGKSRDYIYNEFKKYNVFTRKYFYPLCSEYPHYKNLSSSKKSNLPIAHKVIREVLSMPFYGALSVSDIEKICNILKSFR
jgi:dTDP-4-amino-4,6-dideoxygalactose transaminase